jgi:hypothetical protein
MEHAMGTFLTVVAIFFLVCYLFGKLADRNWMHYRAKGQLKYNDVYAKEAAKKEAREKRKNRD